MNLKNIVILVLVLSAAVLNLAFEGEAAAAETRLQAILRTVVVPHRYRRRPMRCQLSRRRRQLKPSTGFLAGSGM